MDSFDQKILDRLRESLDADARADRRICEDAGIGPNYLRGVFKEKKKISTEYLMRILDQLGPAPTIYVLTGLGLDELDIDFMKVLQNIPKASKPHALELFRTMQTDEE